MDVPPSFLHSNVIGGEWDASAKKRFFQPKTAASAP